jgi:hypothetical protein
MLDETEPRLTHEDLAVAADVLEEAGFPRVAEALRRAFVGGRESPDVILSLPYYKARSAEVWEISTTFFQFVRGRMVRLWVDLRRGAPAR